MNRLDIEKIIQEHLVLNSRKEIKNDSFESYLHNHLTRLLAILKKENNSREVLESGKKFILFCTDSMDWDDVSYKELVGLGEAVSKLAKAELNK